VNGRGAVKLRISLCIVTLPTIADGLVGAAGLPV
jgi:hypothetical protein